MPCKDGASTRSTAPTSTTFQTAIPVTLTMLSTVILVQLLRALTRTYTWITSKNWLGRLGLYFAMLKWVVAIDHTHADVIDV